MSLLDYLDTNYFIILPALWVLGFALKQTPKIPDWSIIWLLSMFSVLLSFLLFGFSGESLINGIIAAGIAIYGHQMVKQTTQKRRTDFRQRRPNK